MPNKGSNPSLLGGAGGTTSGAGALVSSGTSDEVVPVASPESLVVVVVTAPPVDEHADATKIISTTPTRHLFAVTIMPSVDVSTEKRTAYVFSDASSRVPC